MITENKHIPSLKFIKDLEGDVPENLKPTNIKNKNTLFISGNPRGNNYIGNYLCGSFAFVVVVDGVVVAVQSLLA